MNHPPKDLLGATPPAGLARLIALIVGVSATAAALAGWAMLRHEAAVTSAVSMPLWRVWGLPCLLFFVVAGLLTAIYWKGDSFRRSFPVVPISPGQDVNQGASFLASILNNVPAMIFVKDAKELRFVSLNRAFTEITGFANEDLLGKCDHDFFEKEQADFFNAIDRNALASEIPIDIGEEEITRKDGQKRILHTRKVSVRDKHGVPQYLLGISNDITEQKKIRDELRVSQNRYEAVVASAGVGILTIDGQGRIASANQCACDIFGCEMEEFVGSSYLNYMAADARAESREVFAELLKMRDAKAVDQRREFIGVRNGGEEFPMWRSITLVETGDEFLAAVMIRDSSEEKAAEQQLIYALQMAESANLAKSEFLATMSHELRTPLNAIIGFSELLAEDAGIVQDPDASSYVKYIAEAGEHLLALINDVLDLSKIEAGQVELDLVEFPVQQFFESTQNTIRSLVESKGNQFSMTLNNLPEVITTDQTKLRQIVINLLSNAAKFTSHGEVAMDVSIEAETADQPQMLVVKVSDTGIGIPEDKLEHVMTAFAQADSTTTRKYGGTGLGLTITRQNCQLLDGDIGVESVFGEGSVFTARIALNQAQPAEAAA